MPTAAKLVAAICFAAVAWVAAALYADAMPEGRSAGYLREVSALVGMICGWSIMGSFASRPHGRVEAMGTGIRTSFIMAVVSLAVFAVAQMLSRSMTGRYKDPVEAVIAVFDLMLSFGRDVLTTEILGVLILGGLFGGAVAHWAGRTWR